MSPFMKSQVAKLLADIPISDYYMREAEKRALRLEFLLATIAIALQDISNR